MTGVLTAIGRRDLPAWLRASSVVWAGAVLCLAVAALTVGFLLFEKSELEASELESAELYARVLQDHAERTFNTIDIALGAIADGLASNDRPQNDAQASRELTRAQLGLPFLRSLSVMTDRGLVVASSVAANVGIEVDLSRVPLPAAGSVDMLGSSVYGRDLVDARAAGAGSASRSAHTFMPLVRGMQSASGAPHFIVAVLNPDFFANAHELTLDDASRTAALLRLDGTILSGTSNLRLSPGDRASGGRIFTEFLPRLESGSYVGPGIDGDKVVTAFRVLRKRPLLVTVERRFEAVMAAFGRTVVWTLGIALGSLCVVGALVVTASRSLRAHERVRVALDATREEVADSERNLRTLVESVHELIFRTDAQGQVTFVNGRWHGLTGRPPAEIVGRRFSSFCAAAERAAVDAAFSPVRAGGESLRVTVTDNRDRILTLELSVSAVADSAGQVVGHAAFAVDVTEREASRQALESQLKFTARLLEVSPTPLFVKDRFGRFTTVNRAWLELMGLRLDQVLGRDSSELFGASGPMHGEHDARLMQSEERVVYENRLVIEGRAPRDTVVTKVRFTRADGVAAGIVGSIIDVTEFREAERRIREARDAAALADSAKSEFIANMSHELRTPLQGIIGFAEIGMELAKDATDFLDMFIDIHAGGQRMLTLVNGLLDVSQMVGAVGSLRLERADVSALVRGAVTQLEDRIAARQQTIRLHGLDECHEADVDAARFQQAVRNVIANAVRFSPVGGAIDIDCASTPKAGICLSIRDQGPGIPAGELETIFDAFVQSSRTRDGSGGTGLGLTITRKIMAAHGGQVTAANADGGGAVLCIRLPAPRPAPDAGDVASEFEAGTLLSTQEP